METLREKSSQRTPLSPAKRALLEMRLQGKAQQQSGYQSIAKRPDEAAAPLSFAQQRLWFLQQMAPDSTAYNMPAAYRLQGMLDSAALKWAFHQVMARHDVLRTLFVVTAGEPAPKLLPVHGECWVDSDLQVWNKSEQQVRLDQLIEREAGTPFDLAAEPPIRVYLLKLAECEHVLLVTLHHIACDGWSIGLFVGEVAACYEARVSGNLPRLPVLPIQYADYAHWQRQQLQGETLERKLAYWRKQLNDAPVLEFPTDYLRSDTSDDHGAHVRFSLSEAETHKLKALSLRAGVTLFTTLLTALAIVLQRYTGQTDIMTGTVVANRDRAEVENLIGFFVNALPLRLDLTGNPSLLELLKRTGKVVQEAYDHQDLPFDRLVQDLKLPRDTSRNPVFQVSLDLDATSDAQQITLPDLHIAALEVDLHATQFDLTIHCSEHDGQLNGLIAYRTSLFAESRIQRLAEHCRHVLTAVADDPDRCVHALPMLSSAEFHQSTVVWNRSEAVFPVQQGVHELFEQQVEANPDAIAIRFGDRRLTYTQLNESSNQLAHYLRKLGVVPESAIGLCVERGPEMIIGILGILKAGGAYVPIDPGYPGERKAFLLQDAAPAVLLTQVSLLDSIASGDLRFVCLDRDSPLIAEQPVSNPVTVTSPQHAAYIIYTSGSTGKPKGVVISHRNVLCSTLARWHHYETPVQCFLLLSSYAFDSSVAGIFWTLSQGGSLCLPREDQILESEQLVALIASQQVTHLLCLPTFYPLLLQRHASSPNSFGSLRTVIVAGESCPPELVAYHYRKLPHAMLFNEYGPTEGTVWASAALLREGKSKVVPIGRPAGHTEIFVLDPWLHPVPVGVTGQLYIGGAGLARGYLHHPDWTAERFIPHLFKTDGSRLYRTGDLVRVQTDGNIEFLGRVDHQVKIRGYRIELGEIEAELRRMAEIRDAVVLVQQSGAGDHWVIAYCLPSSDHQEQGIAGGQSVRSRLGAVLPAYMVPAAVVFLDQFPLTPNGKIDHQALRMKDALPATTEQAAPHSETERLLAAIWSQALGMAGVGVHDNFFELGGHSMLCMQVITEIDKRCQVRLTVQQFFNHPTVVQLAALVDCGGSADAEWLPQRADLIHEARLDPTIQLASAPDWYCRHPETLLLTGATGFLGVFLLYELLQQTTARVICLIRAESDEHALDKLHRAFVQYELADTALLQRVVPVCGDLSAERFGLSVERFEQLAREVDWIYHNGALVSFLQPYTVLKAANVTGTETVLRLACQYKTKPVHYISTLSVFGGEPPVPSSGGFAEDDNPEPDFDQDDGYSQTKWVAERMVWEAASRGLPVTVHRPSTVTGHSRTGAWNPDNFLCRLMRGCCELGMAPHESMAFDVVPVDYVSRAIVHLSRQTPSIGQAFHYNQEPVSSESIIDWIDACGYPIARVTYRQWREAIAECCEQSNEHALYPLLSMFQEDLAEDRVETHHSSYRTEKTVAALAASGIGCPAADRTVFTAYLAYLQRGGILPHPSRNGNAR